MRGGAVDGRSMSDAARDSYARAWQGWAGKSSGSTAMSGRSPERGAV